MGIGTDADEPQYVSVGLPPSKGPPPSKLDELSAGSRAFRAALLERVLPALRRFAPELILVSTGFDGGLGPGGALLNTLANASAAAQNRAAAARGGAAGGAVGAAAGAEAGGTGNE